MLTRSMSKVGSMSVVAGLLLTGSADAKPGDGAYIKVKPISKKAVVIDVGIVGDRFALLDEEQDYELDIDAYPGESRQFNSYYSLIFGSETKTGRVSQPKPISSAPDDVTVTFANSEIFKGAWVENECMARLQNASNQSGKSKAKLLSDGWWTSFKTSIPIEVLASADDPWTPFIQELPRRGTGVINGVTVMCGESKGAGVGEAGMGPGFTPPPQGPEGEGGGSGSADPRPPRQTTPARQTKPARQTSAIAQNDKPSEFVLSRPLGVIPAGGLNPSTGRWGSNENGSFLRLLVRNDGLSKSDPDMVIFTLVDNEGQTTLLERNLPSLEPGEVHLFTVAVDLAQTRASKATATVRSNGEVFDFIAVR